VNVNDAVCLPYYICVCFTNILWLTKAVDIFDTVKC